jgi:ComF family protein
MWIIKRLVTKSLALLFPSKCTLCGVSGAGVCDNCLSTLTRAVEVPHPRIYAHFSYKDQRIRSMLQKIKYFRKLFIIESLIQHVSNSPFLVTFIGTKENTILIPIPMSKKRLLERGSNHTEHIARAFSTQLTIPMETKLLIRKKDTVQQVQTHSKKERIRNIRKAFTVDKKHLDTLKDKRIILVDDVTTTGSTINEAVKVLEKAGFRDIKAITLAH